MTPEIAEALGLKEAQGAMVTEVTPDSPAAKAGLKQGDVILNFAGKKVGGPRELARVVAEEPAGSKTSLTVWRDRGENTLAVVTGQKPGQARLAAARSEVGVDGTVHSADLNVDLAPLTPERRAELGIGEGVNGVLVLDVKEGSVFEQGLRAGDVIKQVGQTPVTSPQEVDALVRTAKSGSEKAILMLVSRQGRDLFLGVNLGIA